MVGVAVRSSGRDILLPGRMDLTSVGGRLLGLVIV